MSWADLTLLKPRHVPQAFCIADSILWVAQANTTSGNALISAYHVSGSSYRPGGQMAIYDCHGWPLIVDVDLGYRRIGVIANDKFCRFRWNAGVAVGASKGNKLPRIPVQGGWARVTSGGEDRFYRGTTLLFTRDSPGWVQGELVRNNVLLTLRGGIIYTSSQTGPTPEIIYTNTSGTITQTLPVTTTIGEASAGVPIGGRREHEGLFLNGSTLLIGTAVNRKPNYRYIITDLGGGF